MTYTVLLQRESDGSFLASAPALPGCEVTGHTRPEVLANIRQAIEEYIADCIDAGDPVPTEEGKELVEIETSV